MRRFGGRALLACLIFLFGTSHAVAAAKPETKTAAKANGRAARLAKNGKNGKNGRKPAAEPPKAADAAAPAASPASPSAPADSASVPDLGAAKPEGKKEADAAKEKEEKEEQELLDELTESLVPQGALPLLQVSARLDSNFTAGNGVVQGFSLPSLRLSVQGDVSPHLGYRVSAGQTREFSSALLPQLMPVEGFIDAATADRRGSSKRATFRVGMFTPTINPWWSPDLTEVAAPDYHESHRSLFLSRDIGAELGWRNGSGSISLGLGAFNGIGVFGQNTNNSRAFNAYLSTRWAFGDIELSLGAAGFARLQATAGNVNYRKQIVGTGWGSISFSGITLYGDLFGGTVEDSVRSLLPFGGSVVVVLPLTGSIRLFGRAEWLDENPASNGGLLSRFQGGPWILFGERLQGWLTYSNQVTGDGSGVTHVTEARLRLDV